MFRQEWDGFVEYLNGANKCIWQKAISKRLNTNNVPFHVAHCDGLDGSGMFGTFFPTLFTCPETKNNESKN